MPIERVIKHVDTLLYLYYQNGSVYEDCGYKSQYYKAVGKPRKLCMLPLQFSFSVFMMEVVRYMEKAVSGADFRFSCDSNGFPVIPQIPMNEKRNRLLERMKDDELCNKAIVNDVRCGETRCFHYCEEMSTAYTIHEEASTFYDYATVLSSVFRFANRYTEDVHNEALALLSALSYEFSGSLLCFCLNEIFMIRTSSPQMALERVKKARNHISLIQSIFDVNNFKNENVFFPDDLLPKLTALDDVVTHKPQTLLHILSDYVKDGKIDARLQIGLVRDMAISARDHKSRRSYLSRLDTELIQLEAYLVEEIKGVSQSDESWEKAVKKAYGQLIPRKWFCRIIDCA